MPARRNQSDLSPSILLREATRIARLAGKTLRNHLSSGFAVHFKGAVDMVTDADRAAQELFAREVHRVFPGHGFLAEEGLDEPGEGTFTWVVDPLDGTTNFVHRFPVFCVSVGVVRGGMASDGEVVCGVVHNPVSRETFTAFKGGGAFLNGRAIRVSGVKALDQSLLATGFPYTIRDTPDNNISHFAALAVRAQGIRRCGAAALDLCHVACGRFDGFWELGLKPWDIAAGSLIVREAGGRVTDLGGGEVFLDGSRLLATNGLIHSEISSVLTDR